MPLLVRLRAIQETLLIRLSALLQLRALQQLLDELLVAVCSREAEAAAMTEAGATCPLAAPRKRTEIGQRTSNLLATLTATLAIGWCAPDQAAPPVRARACVCARARVRAHDAQLHFLK